MALIQRGVRTIRSREDYDLFRIVFPNYDPRRILSIHLRIAPGQLIKPGVPFATITICSDSNSQQQQAPQQSYELSIQQPGRVQRVGEDFSMEEGRSEYTIAENVKNGSLELFFLRDCQHQPGGESFLRESDLTQSTARGFHSLCIHCSKPLWIYYQSQEVQITLGKLLLSNNHFMNHQKLPELEWTVILNEQFTPTVSIAKVDDQNFNLPFLAKPTFLLNFQQYGKRLNNEMVVMKIKRVICRHEKLIDGRCQYCMQEIKDDKFVKDFTTYLFQMDQGLNAPMLVKGNALKQQQQTFIDGLMKTNKAIMILDLDNTILHSNEMSELQPETVLGLTEYYLIPKIETYPNSSNLRTDFIVVKMRPFFKHFLFQMDRLFEIYVYTKGTRPYAEQICKFIRAQYAGQFISHRKTWTQTETFLVESRNFQEHRIISRNEDSNLETKSMQKILPTRKQYHIILDDRRDVWRNSPSWYYTQQYNYFNRKMRLTTSQPRPKKDFTSYVLDNIDVDIPELKKDLMADLEKMKQQFPQKDHVIIQTVNKPDYFLLFAAHALAKLHKAFFDYRRNNQKDMKQTKQQPESRQPKQEKERKQSKLSKKNKEVKEGKEIKQVQDDKDGKQTKEQIDKSSIYYIQHRLKHFFNRKKMRFFVPGEDPHGTIRRAQKLGASIFTIEDKEPPKFVIRSVNFITQYKQYLARREASKQPQLMQIQEDINEFEKVIEKQQERKPVLISPTYDYESEYQELKKIIERKIPIVSESWIQTSYELNYFFPYQKFLLVNPLQEGQDRALIDSTIESVANKIRKEIEDKIQKDARKA